MKAVADLVCPNGLVDSMYQGLAGHTLSVKDFHDSLSFESGGKITLIGGEPGETGVRQ